MRGKHGRAAAPTEQLACQEQAGDSSPPLTCWQKEVLCKLAAVSRAELTRIDVSYLHVHRVIRLFVPHLLEMGHVGAHIFFVEATSVVGHLIKLRGQRWYGKGWQLCIASFYVSKIRRRAFLKHENKLVLLDGLRLSDHGDSACLSRGDAETKRLVSEHSKPGGPRRFGSIWGVLSRGSMFSLWAPT